MDSIQNVINMLKPRVFLDSIDLKDAFLSEYIIITKRSLNFFIKDYHKFVCMPNSCSPAIIVLTNITNVPFKYI